MDKYQSGIGLGVILFIIGLGIVATGWGISEARTDRFPDSQDYYLHFGLAQLIMIVGATLLLVGIVYAIIYYRAERLRKRRLFCPYCGREVGAIGDECTGCGGRL